MKARLLPIMGLLTAFAAARPAAAEGPWSIEPRLGVETDYNSNPLLHQTDVQAEERVAATVDLPLRYDTDDMEFFLRPNGRLSNSPGYSSLASNYAHLDAAAVFNNELGSTSLQGEVARDSSLYYVGGLVNGIGVPRDTANTNADWTHALTERSQVEVDAGWTRVRYDQPADLNALVDYRYISAGPTLSYMASERDTFKLLGSYGLYQSLNGITESRSKSKSLQLGFVRQLTEIWTLSASAGYSESVNSEKVYVYGIFYLGTETSNQDGAVYAATLTRQGEKFSLSAGASQALQPTGFNFLSRQSSLNLTMTFTQSERWDYALLAAWVKATNPIETSGQVGTQEASTRFLNPQLTANWHWTPQWVVSLSATRITQQYGPPTVSAASSGLRLSLVRQFLRTQF